MKNTTLATIFFSLVFLGTGCNFQQTEKVKENNVPSRGTIGLSVLTLTNPFFTVIAENLSLEAKKHGYEVLVTSGEFDVARQHNQVKDFIVQKVNAIVLCPCDSKAIGPAIKEANEAGIPVLRTRYIQFMNHERSIFIPISLLFLSPFSFLFVLYY